MSEMMTIYHTDSMTRYAPPTRDKYGKITTAAVSTQISCRLDFSNKMVIDETGERVVSTARAQVALDVINAHTPEHRYDFGSYAKRRVIAIERFQDFDKRYGVLNFE